MPTELEPTEPDQRERVVGDERERPIEGLLGLVVERGIGGLADALEEGEPEVAQSLGVIGCRPEALAEGGDLGDGPLGRRCGGGRARAGRCRRRRRPRGRGARLRRALARCEGHGAAAGDEEAEEDGADRAP